MGDGSEEEKEVVEETRGGRERGGGGVADAEKGGRNEGRVLPRSEADVRQSTKASATTKDLTD